MAKVSVVIPTYNRVAYLRQAIDSALAQTYGDLEVIVVDDSSTDDTPKVVSSYGSKVRYILQDNRERGAARNTGIKNSSGEYVAFLDSDDMWLPRHLEACVRALESCPDCVVSFSGSLMMGEDSKLIGKLPARHLGHDALKQIISSYSSGGCNASSCLIRKEAFSRAGYFSQVRALSGSEDWELWTRMAAVGGFIFTGKFTARVRFHPGKSSVDPDRMARSMKMSLDMVYENKDLLPKIAGFKKRAHGSLYTVTAINYYAAGRMPEARAYLNLAVKGDPFSLLTNKYVIYTYLRSLLGRGVSSNLRKIKYLMTGALNR